MPEDIVRFTRNRDYRLVRELGRGGCGRTVLLHDDVIDEHFVCKKYDPSDTALKEELFQGFMTEIKLMHGVYHPNVVRIFNYHVIPHRHLGFITMEYVAGQPIDKYVEAYPKSLPAVFRQVVSAFCHLWECKILHRDIRPQNLLVSDEGAVKLIDLGFGKRIETNTDFAKSITLNWAYTPPRDFENDKYDYRSEVYFVGKLFERIMADNGIVDDQVSPVIRVMCAGRPQDRFESFGKVREALEKAGFSGEEFDEFDISNYRDFANELDAYIAEMEVKATYIWDVSKVIEQLQKTYQSCMLEESVDGSRVARCFISGSFKVFRKNRLHVANLRWFLNLLKASQDDRRRVVLANLYGRLDQKKRYDEDELPF